MARLWTAGAELSQQDKVAIILDESRFVPLSIGGDITNMRKNRIFIRFNSYLLDGCTRVNLKDHPMKSLIGRNGSFVYYIDFNLDCFHMEIIT